MSNFHFFLLVAAAAAVRLLVFGSDEPELKLGIPWLVPALVGGASLFFQKKINDSAQRNAMRAQQEAERRQWEERERREAPRRSLISGVMRAYGLDNNPAFRGYFDYFNSPRTFSSQQPGFSTGSSMWPFLLGGAQGYLSWMNQRPPLPTAPPEVDGR